MELKKRKSVVLVPYPLQGHFTPMLQLGSVLHSLGFSIIVAHIEFNAPSPREHPDFSFLPIGEHLSHLSTKFEDMLTFISKVNTHAKGPLQERLNHIMTEEQEIYGQISCVIYDPIMTFSEAAANHLKLPSIIMFTSSCSTLLTYLNLPRLQAEGYIPLQDSLLQEPVPDLQPFRFKDLPLFLGNFPPELFENMSSVRTSSAYIFNTAEYLEASTLLSLQRYHQVPFFPVGPFHKMTPSSTSMLKEDASCMTWLDKQPPQSVIYVSHGSIVTMDEKEVLEMAWGLANSDQPFLWVIRSNSTRELEWTDLFPQDLKEKVSKIGYIVDWAPQKEVLAHVAVGGFLSHCGWNSTLESIAEGIPMICRPGFGDQKVNTRYITHVWKIGLELDDEILGREEVERAVRRLMSGEREQMRQSAKEMQKKAKECLQKGGSTYHSLQQLAEFISSF